MKCDKCKHFQADPEMQMKLGSCKKTGEVIVSIIHECKHCEGI